MRAGPFDTHVLRPVRDRRGLAMRLHGRGWSAPVPLHGEHAGEFRPSRWGRGEVAEGPGGEAEEAQGTGQRCVGLSFHCPVHTRVRTATTAAQTRRWQERANSSPCAVESEDPSWGPGDDARLQGHAWETQRSCHGDTQARLFSIPQTDALMQRPRESMNEDHESSEIGHPLLNHARAPPTCPYSIYYLSLHLRFAPAEEPPAEEANEASDDNDGCNSDACNSAGRKTATLVGIRRLAPVLSGDRAVSSLALAHLLAVRRGVLRAVGIAALPVDLYVVRIVGACRAGLAVGATRLAARSGQLWCAVGLCYHKN
eukprot:XP_001708196.1 Hypothetical protein GL50803_87110 [Giardia lamblia ATCC 50803]